MPPASIALIAFMGFLLNWDVFTVHNARLSS
jgi:hypothetical protein